MAYPDRIWRCNIVGETQGGEQLVHTVWMRADGSAVIGPAATQTIANKVRDRWQHAVLTGHTSGGPLATRLHTGTRYTRVSAYRVNAQGLASDQAEALFDPATVKGSVTRALPPQCALVVTLQTSKPGRSGRGRLYLGGLGDFILGNDGRVPAGHRDLMSDTMATFYTSLRDENMLPDVVRPVVVSNRQSDSYKVTKVAIGDVFDTQRRRRASLVESKAVRVVDAS